MKFTHVFMRDFALDVIPSLQGDKGISQIEVGYEYLGFINTTIGHSMLVVISTKVVIEVEEDEEPLILPDCCP